MKQSLAVVLVGALAMAACQPEPAEETTEDPAIDTVAAPATVTLEDFAGTWNMRAQPQAGTDTSTTVFQAQVTADSWTIMFPDRDPVVAVANAAGDSVVVDAGPYESVRREGLTVRTHSVYRLVDGRLVGTTVARYETTEADSVLMLDSEGTRAE